MHTELPVDYADESIDRTLLALDRDGFAVVPGALSAADVAEFVSAAEHLAPFASDEVKEFLDAARGKAGGFTLVEMMVAFGLLLLGLGIATVAGKTVRADGRRATCVTNQASIFAAKRMAWEANESLNAVADPDGTVISYLDSNNLPFCPNNGTHKPAAGVKPTATNTLASYNIVAATEATVPTCKIAPTEHIRN